MGNIIPFPGQDQKESVDAVRAKVLAIGEQMGLSEVQSDEVFQEYREIHDELFENFEIKLMIPVSADLTQEQIEAVAVAHAESINDLMEDHAKKLSTASHAVIGVLMREKLRAQ